MQKFQPRLSPKECAIYQALVDFGREASPLEIAVGLNIQTTLAYKYLNYLNRLGLVEKTSENPIKYTALPFHNAQDNFLLEQELWFHNTFIQNDKVVQNRNDPDFKFFKNHEELISASTEDLARTHYGASLIVSGGEIPAETIQAQKRAIKAGVKIRLLIQNHHQISRQMFDNWLKLGLEVKLIDMLPTRLYIYMMITPLIWLICKTYQKMTLAYELSTDQLSSYCIRHSSAIGGWEGRVIRLAQPIEHFLNAD